MVNIPKQFDLSGKVALITGATGLLGMEHAKSLLETGATIILTDINTQALDKSKELLAGLFPADNILCFKMDVTDKASIQDTQVKISSLGLRVDILINNASINPKVEDNSFLHEVSRLEHFPQAEWNLQVSVGLTGAFLCSQVFGTQMAIDGKGGVILNIASDLSVISPDQRLYRKESLDETSQPVKPVTYSVIKSGLIGLTRYLATYWAEKGVRANALSPGGIFNGQNDEFVLKIASLIPLGRMANKDEYRGAVQFLCSDASAYLNGQNIVMDGGRSTW